VLRLLPGSAEQREQCRAIVAGHPWSRDAQLFEFREYEVAIQGGADV
jgi:hypothetical protein